MNHMGMMGAMNRAPTVISPSPPQWGGGRGVGPARGQALVEFALVMPLFLAMVLGLTEASLAYGATALYHHAVEVGARMAALTANRVGTSDAQAISVIMQTVQPYFLAHISQIVIYQSDANGAGPQASSENVFDGAGNPIAPQTWPIASRTSTLAAPIFLGVRITYRYTWLTSFIGVIGTSVTLLAMAVVPILPTGG